MLFAAPLIIGVDTASGEFQMELISVNSVSN